MTTIGYDLENFIITAEGHAGYGDRGNDIVCAAVSTLMHSLSVYLLNNRDLLEADAQIETMGGFMAVKCCPMKEHESELRAAFEVCVLGLICIGDKYPKYVKVGG